MTKHLFKSFAIMLLGVLALASCSGNDVGDGLAESRVSNLSDFRVVVNATVGGATRMNPESGQWQNGDEIFIALDGSDSNSYVLRYVASSGEFVISPLNRSAAGFSEHGTVTGFYASEAALSYDGQDVKGSTTGDIVYTEQGDYTVSGKTITINMRLNERKMSLVKITGLKSEAYVSNMKQTFTRLTSLASPAWEVGGVTPSYIYNAAEGTAYCYGVVPDDGRITLKYKDGLYYTLNNQLPTLAPGEMTELASPDAEPDKWTVEESKYYNTGDVVTYNKATSSKAFTMVVLSEGYAQENFLRTDSKFVKDATAVMDMLFSIEPYSRLRPYINVYFIAAVSKDNGATVYENGNNGSAVVTQRDTYFKVGWGQGNNGYSNMGSSNENGIYSFAQQYCPDLNGRGSHSGSIYNTGILVLVNDSRYGGITHTVSNGLGIAYASEPLGALAWNNPVGAARNRGTWINVAVHEFGGHCVGRLTDEYVHSGTGAISTYRKGRIVAQQNYSVPFARNLTVDKDNYYWSWMPSRGYSGEGLYEGGYTYEREVWRPEPVSCMIDNRPYFNAYSRYLIMERIFGVCGLTFNQDVFVDNDSHISSYTGAAAVKQLWGGGSVAGERLMPMPAEPVVVEAE